MKIDLISTEDNEIEIRFFEHFEDIRYRSWTIPLVILDDVIDWWIALNINSLPIKTPYRLERKNCIFEMESREYIHIKEIAKEGYIKNIGWTLPVVILQYILEAKLIKTRKESK